MELSRVTARFQESVIREMTRVCRQHPGTVNLAQGFPDFAAPAEIKQAAMDAIAADVNQYSITWGAKRLRDAIVAKAAAYNDITADPETDVTVTCGSTEAMMASVRAITNPGDEVVIFEPFYENYGPDCLLCDVRPKFVPLAAPDWRFDPAALAGAFTSRTKAIIINTPNNPTGKVFSRDELRVMADLCVDHDCIAVTDEIYEHILYDGARHVSIAALPGMADRAITINAISKTYSLTGWRVGWAIAPARITAEIKKVHDFLTVGAAAPLQEGAAHALGMGPEYYAGLAEFYQEARDTLYAALVASPLQPSHPAGAYYIMCECGDYMAEHGLRTARELAIHLVETIGVGSVPGSSFHPTTADGTNAGQTTTRFCFCKKPETLAAAAERIARL